MDIRTKVIYIIRSYPRQLYLALFFCLISIAAAGQNIRYDTIQYAKEYYQKRIAIFNTEPVIEHKIIFLGNSLTQFGNWKILLHDSTIINRGIAGDNTYGVLARLNDVLIRKPAQVFIEIGINDICQNIPRQIIAKNILSIVKKIHINLPGTKVYVTSILPTNDNVRIEYPAAYHKDDQINFINRELLRHAVAYRYTYIDLNNKVKDKSGNLDVRYAKSDGIHLNEQAYQLWVELIKAKLSYKHTVKNRTHHEAF